MQAQLQRESGFSLLEVLIALMILSIGLLGIAALQLNGLRTAHDASLRYLAVLSAYDIIDRMRANSVGVAAGAYNSISGVGSNPGCISTNCTPAQMAATDAYQWNTNNAQSLPSGAGTVTGAGTGSVFVITVTWTEIQPGTQAPVQQSFVMRVTP